MMATEFVCPPINTFTDYIHLAARTARTQARLTPAGVEPPSEVTALDERLEVAGYGLIGETGEIADLLKKVRGHGHPFDPVKLAKECGDVAWYIADLAGAIGIGGENFSFPVSTCTGPWRDVWTRQWVAPLGDFPLADPANLQLHANHFMAVRQLAASSSEVGSRIWVLLYRKAGVSYEPILAELAARLSQVLLDLKHLLFAFGLRFADVLRQNIEKLAVRYPDGFSHARSLNRPAE